MKNKGYAKFFCFFGGGGGGGQKRGTIGDVQVAYPRKFGYDVSVHPHVRTDSGSRGKRFLMVG